MCHAERMIPYDASEFRVPALATTFAVGAGMSERERLNTITEAIIKSAISVHRELVEDAVIVEVKSIDRFHPVHGAQLVSYLRLSGCKVGLLINFNVKWLVEDGIMRRVNGFPE